MPLGIRLPFFYGWVIVGVAMLAMFVSGPGQTIIISRLVDEFIEDLELSRSLISSLYTIGSLIAAVAMVAMGWLLDRYGSRVTLTLATIAFGFVVLGMSEVDNAVQLLAGFAGLRILGVGALMLIPTTMAALWFVRFRGRAVAITNLGVSLSLVAFPPLVHVMISIFDDWRKAWVIMAIGVWSLLLLPAILLVRRSPESIGLLPDGNRPGQAQDNPRATSDNYQEPDLTLREIIRTRTFWLLFFSSSVPMVIPVGMVFHHVSVFDSKGVDPGVATGVLSVIAASSLVGTLMAGVLSETVPNRFIIVGNQAMLATAMGLTFVLAQPVVPFIYGVMLGLSIGSQTNISFVVWANYYGRRSLGSIRGIGHFGYTGFAALGPMPFGFLFDLTDAYTVPVLVLLALPATTTVASLLAQPPQKTIRGT